MKKKKKKIVMANLTGAQKEKQASVRVENGDSKNLQCQVLVQLILALKLVE